MNRSHLNTIFAASLALACTGPTAHAEVSDFYWSRIYGSSRGIHHGTADGSTTTQLHSPWDMFPEDIAVDFDAGKIYWVTSGGDGMIERGNLDGTGTPEHLLDYQGLPASIVLDTVNGKMYFGEWISDSIKRANLDGTGLETVVTGIDRPAGLALDIDNETIYWTNNSGSLGRVNYDGSGFETLISTDEAWSAEGIALDLDAGKMYWVTTGFMAGLYTAPLTGEDPVRLIAMTSYPHDLALDLEDGHVYWTDGGDDVIRRSNLDGSSITDMVTGLPDSPVGFAMRLGPPVTPGPTGDLDGDGLVAFSDLLIVLGAWGACPAPPAACPADLDGSGDVAFADILVLIANWS